MVDEDRHIRVGFDVDESPEPEGGLGFLIHGGVDETLFVCEDDRDQVRPSRPAERSQCR